MNFTQLQNQHRLDFDLTFRQMLSKFVHFFMQSLFSSSCWYGCTDTHSKSVATLDMLSLLSEEFSKLLASETHCCTSATFAAVRLMMSSGTRQLFQLGLTNSKGHDFKCLILCASSIDMMSTEGYISMGHYKLQIFTKKYNTLLSNIFNLLQGVLVT